MNELFLISCESQEENQEVKEAVNKVLNIIGGIVPDAEDLLTYIGYLYEKQGFQNGYRMAAERGIFA